MVLSCSSSDDNEMSSAQPTEVRRLTVFGPEGLVVTPSGAIAHGVVPQGRHRSNVLGPMPGSRAANPGGANVQYQQQYANHPGFPWWLRPTQNY
eukprot:GHVS01064885.1.p1 GENE.GHVS01064885.1~~GHVS01064885.1.p1  ORF type:complete len:106 (-),score=16.87 GHVS01064885.1:184-465(-)